MTDWLVTQSRTGLGVFCCMLVFLEAMAVTILLGWWRAVRTRHRYRPARPRDFMGE